MASHVKNKLCACGCGQLGWGKLIRGHRLREVSPVTPEPLVAAAATPIVAEGPPPDPVPIDRRRWRIASERPGTPRSNPWIPTKCNNCLLPMYTRDLLSTWEHGGYCEECEYILRSNLYDRDHQRYQSQARTLIDPFRPRS